MNTPRDIKLTEISEKLDQLLSEEGIHIFDPSEIKVLQKMIAVYQKVEGWVSVTNRLGIIITFLVVLITQWGHGLDLLKQYLGIKP